MKDYQLQHLIGQFALDFSDYMDLFTLHNGGTDETRKEAREKHEASMNVIHEYMAEKYQRKYEKF